MCSFPLLLFRHRDMITSIVCRRDVMGGEESFTKQTPPHAGSRLQNTRVGREGNLRFLLACQAARNCLNSNANVSFFLALMWLQTITPTEVKIFFCFTSKTHRDLNKWHKLCSDFTELCDMCPEKIHLFLWHSQALQITRNSQGACLHFF